MHLIWAGLILGVAAVWGVPIIASLLNSILPATVQPYLPSSTVPGVTTQSVVTAVIYGILLAGVLHVLRMVGLRGARA
jgi:hypothetical protein